MANQGFPWQNQQFSDAPASVDVLRSPGQVCLFASLCLFSLRQSTLLAGFTTVTLPLLYIAAAEMGKHNSAVQEKLINPPNAILNDTFTTLCLLAISI